MSTMSTKKQMYDIAVIGGGAAGMFSAGIAAGFSARVVLIEQNPFLGKKLNITGKGRCNLTNRCSAEEVLRNVPQNGKFLYSAMNQFPPEAAITFFEDHGCPTKTERGNRVFPVSDRARDVTDTLSAFVGEQGVTVRRAKARQLLVEAGCVKGVQTDHETVAARRVILCTGGCSYPLTGSDGSGYAIAQVVGHTIIPPVGALVPLQERGNCCRRMAGLSLRNVALRLLRDGKTVYTDFGELEFTEFGLTGPTILSASAHMRAAGSYTVQIDLKPALSPEKLEARLLRDLAARQNLPMQAALGALLPSKMIPVILDQASISPSLAANSLRRAQRRALLTELKQFSIPIAGLRPVEEAIVTSGGVKVSEINPRTMESKLVRGLYFAGEILDVDAYTGGFNLQIAWATAHAAALAAGNSLADVLY